MVDIHTAAAEWAATIKWLDAKIAWMKITPAVYPRHEIDGWRVVRANALQELERLNDQG